jgi:predicted FMN-binding regulatory protein PaiB
MHLAHANAQWRELAAVEECLFLFQGAAGLRHAVVYQTKR